MLAAAFRDRSSSTSRAEFCSACRAERHRFPFLAVDSDPRAVTEYRRQSKKSMQRLKAKVRELLVPSNNEPWQDVRKQRWSALAFRPGP